MGCAVQPIEMKQESIKTPTGIVLPTFIPLYILTINIILAQLNMIMIYKSMFDIYKYQIKRIFN